MTVQAKRDISRKLRILNHGRESGNISKTCRYFGISREIFYRWKRTYEEVGEKGLINKKPCPENPKIKVLKHIEDKILYLRRTYHFGPPRIVWYLSRYHNIKVSEGGVRGVLRRHGLNRLPRNIKRRAPGPHFTLYEKQVSGHHIQMDDKFLKLTNNKGQNIRRFQYTAIDDATRIRVLKIYDKHTQQDAIDLVNMVILKLPFRIKMVRTDNGHEFQSKFHWHLMDLGISHAYIKKGTPRLNGKVGRSLRTDDQEFYQLLSFKDDVDLEKKLKTWEGFYNLHRPHSAHDGKLPMRF